MKHLTLIVLAVLLINCKQKNTSQTIAEAKNDNNIPTWLIGSWEREENKEGEMTYEHWQQNEDGDFIGMGCTIQGTDTVWKEDILLSEVNGNWTFDVIGKGETSATSFEITQMEKEKFTCKNDSNEFPKKIEYYFQNGKINALISGGGPAIPFNFKKMGS